MRPDIFADRNPDAIAGVVDDGGRGRRFEIAILVEDVVRRKQTFSSDCPDFYTITKRCRVEEWPAATGGVGFNGADDRGHGTNAGCKLPKRIRDIGDETSLEQQIAWRIATHGELGKNDKLGTLRDERGVTFEDFAPIAGEIANRRIELSEAKTHEKRRNVNGFVNTDN